MPELEEVKTRLNLSRPFEELPTRNHYSHAQRDVGSVQVRGRKTATVTMHCQPSSRSPQPNAVDNAVQTTKSVHTC